MDKEQAQFILHSFRPDGADAADSDFAEALQLAAEDRELGEWLADERAADSAFAAALSEVEIPDELRMHILAVMRGEKPGNPAQETEMDDLLVDALSHVDPPAGLRDQILAAMYVQEAQVTGIDGEANHESAPENVTAMPEAPAARSRLGWQRIASLAAAVVLGGFLAMQIDLGGSSSSALANRVAAYDVQTEAARMLNSKFALDVVNSQPAQVTNWLVDQQLPAPSRLPSGLQGMKMMGCKKIQLAGDRSASLLCFVKSSGDKIHLVVINNDHIRDAHLPGMDEVKKGDCYHCPKTGWNMTKWRDRDNTYLLFAKKETTSQDELIRYF